VRVPGLIVALALALLGGLAGRAGADDEIVRGAVVRIEAKEIYVSLGGDRGVVPGAALRIKRAITLKHPITRAAISDWLPIASAKVTEAGGSLSRAVVGELVSEIKLGDIAEVLVDRPDAPQILPPPPEQVPTDPATAEVLGVVAAQANQGLEVRIAGWEHYLSQHPTSRFASAVRGDLDELRSLRDQMKPPGGIQGADQITTVAHASPRLARANEALQVVFVLDQPTRVASAYLHYRPVGARTYHALLLTREHDLYLRGAIPATAVALPGLEYFVEVTAPNGRSGLALGSPAQPVDVAVREPPPIDRLGSDPLRTTVRLTAEALDFRTFDSRSGDHTDRTSTADLDVVYRLRSAIESVGVGFGAYSGVGGAANEVWTAANPAPRSDFRYGHADVEAGGHVHGMHLSLGGQVIAGVSRFGFGLGVEGRFRIGDRDATNLVVSSRTIDRVGFLSEVRFATRPWRRLGIAFSVGATDQPNERETAVKLGTEVELFAVRNVAILARGSWQGRSTEHGGLGGGGGLGVTW
jgi:hypothetical protein